MWQLVIRLKQWLDDFGLIVVPILLLIGLGVVGASWYYVSAYDVVIQNARVIDPETGMDRVVYLGINANKIAAVSAVQIRGHKVINGNGLIVGPGFIDIAAHAIRRFDQDIYLSNGVTTVLDFSVGQNAGYDFETIERPMLNIGVALDVSAYGQDPNIDISNIKRALTSGAIGMVWRIPAYDARSEGLLIPLIHLAGTYQRPLSIQIPTVGSPDQIRRLIRLTGDLAHVVSASVIIQQLPRRAHVFTHSAVAAFDQLNPSASVWFTLSPYKGELLTNRSIPFPVSFYRSNGCLVFDTFNGGNINQSAANMIVFSVSQSALDRAVIGSRALIASDARIDTNPIHPRYSGTFARVVRQWVLTNPIMDWLAVFELLSLRPAMVLAPSIPAMAHKGRVQIGADADLIAIDPKKIEDWATYQHPIQPSVGVVWVMVNGRIVRQNGAPIKGYRPGKWLSPNEGAL